MAAVHFDLRRIFDSVDSERDRLGLSWSALAREVGVSASTIRRFRVADDAEADGVLALVRWLRVSPEDFVINGSVSGDELQAPGAGVVRVDMDRIATADGDARGARGRTRTTMQHLVSVAQGAGVTVASLTRVSDV